VISSIVAHISALLVIQTVLLFIDQDIVQLDLPVHARIHNPNTRTHAEHTYALIN